MRGLSRGFDSLLSDRAKTVIADKPPVQTSKNTLAVDQLQRGRYQPRTDFDPESLQELAESIKAQGVIQPLIVRKTGDNKFEIIAGERRWRAAQMAGLHDVPVVIRDIDDEAAMAMSLIENIQREDLNAIEEAGALHRLVEEFGLTQEDVATAVGKSRSTVTNLLRLLKLNADVKTLVENGDLEAGHAKVLLGLHGDQQSSIAKHVAEKNLSVRETESLVRRTLAGPSAPVTKPSMDPDVARLQNQLSERIGAKVNISHQPKGKGKLEIFYHSLDELDGILERIQ